MVEVQPAQQRSNGCELLNVTPAELPRRTHAVAPPRDAFGKSETTEVLRAHTQNERSRCRAQPHLTVLVDPRPGHAPVIPRGPTR